MFSLSIFPFVWMGERNFISRDLFLRSWGLLYSSIKMQTAERRIIAWEGIASCTELEDYFIRLFPTCCSWLRAKCSGNGTCSGLLQESVSRSESGRKGAKGFWGPGRDFMGLKNGGGGKWTNTQSFNCWLLNDWIKRKRQEIMKWQSSWIIIIKFTTIMASL